MKNEGIILKRHIELVGRTAEGRRLYHFIDVNKYWLAPAYTALDTFVLTNRPKLAEYLRVSLGGYKTKGTCVSGRSLGNIENYEFDVMWPKLCNKLTILYKQRGCSRAIINRIEDICHYLAQRGNRVYLTVFHEGKKKHLGAFDADDEVGINAKIAEAHEAHRRELQQRKADAIMPLEEAFILLDSPDGIVLV